MHYFHPQSAILYDTETEEKIQWTNDRWAPVVVTVRIFKMRFMFLSLCLNRYNSSLRHSKSTTRHLNIFSIGLAKADNSKDYNEGKINKTGPNPDVQQVWSAN